MSEPNKQEQEQAREHLTPGPIPETWRAWDVGRGEWVPLLCRYKDSLIGNAQYHHHDWIIARDRFDPEAVRVTRSGEVIPLPLNCPGGKGPGHDTTT